MCPLCFELTTDPTHYCPDMKHDDELIGTLDLRPRQRGALVCCYVCHQYQPHETFELFAICPSCQPAWEADDSLHPVIRELNYTPQDNPF